MGACHNEKHVKTDENLQQTRVNIVISDWDAKSERPI